MYQACKMGKQYIMYSCEFFFYRNDTVLMLSFTDYWNQIHIPEFHPLEILGNFKIFQRFQQKLLYVKVFNRTDTFDSQKSHVFHMGCQLY